MRSVIVSMNISLNGCMASRNGELDWHYHSWDEDMARVTALQLSMADTILLGRITYEAMAGYYTQAAIGASAARGDVDFLELINRAEKVFFSKTFSKAPAWINSRLSKKSVKEEIKALRNTPGKDIMVYGSGEIVTTLIKLGVVDEYRLWVHPVVIENGRPLFCNVAKTLKFQSKITFASGVVLMTYKVIC